MTIRQLPVAPAGRPCAGVTSEPQPLNAGMVGSGLHPIMTTRFLFLMLLDVITGMRVSRQNVYQVLYVR